MRTHEKALANALQLRQQSSREGQDASQTASASQVPLGSSPFTNPTSSVSSVWAAALSFGAITFTSQSVKPAKLTLTPHHLFYLLSRFEDLGVPVGPLSVRTENLHAEASPANYVSFLSQAQRPQSRSDRDSIHSVTSVRSVMSSMSALWSNLGSSNSAAKSEKAQAQLMLDLKYLYSAFTKIPCLRLSPGRKAHLIRGYEEFPFDTAVPLLTFKNLSALEICDVDFRQFFGWDRLADQLRSLTVKRAHVDDPADVFISIVLDDMDKRRRRSSKVQMSPVLAGPLSPPVRFAEATKVTSTHGSLVAGEKLGQGTSPQGESPTTPRYPSNSPNRPTSSRQNTPFRHVRSNSTKVKRSGSGSSDSSVHSNPPSGAVYKTGSSSNLLLAGTLPASKWRFLRHLSLADNALTSISSSSLAPLSNTLHSLDLSSNLFTDVPDGLANLIVLRALNLSNCMIGSLQPLLRNPLPAITALNLRANRLKSIVGIERLLSLERLDLRENRLGDPTELARLTGLPDFREVWVAQNPFTKSHSNYRVTIFNMFRSTPGLMDDITIDASGPVYGERRHLVDRIAEGEPMSVVKTMHVEAESLPSAARLSQQDTRSGFVIDAKVFTQDESILKPNSHGYNPKTKLDDVRNPKAIGHAAARAKRSKRGIRRQRLVDLAADQDGPLSLVQSPPGSTAMIQEPKTQPRTAISNISANLAVGKDDMTKVLPSNHADVLDQSYSKTGSIEHEVAPPQLPQVSHLFSSGDQPVPINDPPNMKLKTQAYRQRVESLKKEVGSNWLSALGEEAWISDRGPDPDASAIRGVRPAVPLLQVHDQGIT